MALNDTIPEPSVYRHNEVLYTNCLPRTAGKRAFLEAVPALKSTENFWITNQTIAFCSPVEFAVVHFYWATNSNVYRNNVSVITLPGLPGDFIHKVHFFPVIVSGEEYILVVAGPMTTATSYVYLIKNSDGVVTGPTTLTNIAYRGNPVVFNNRLYVADTRTQRIYNSAVGDFLSFSLSTDFIEAEFKSDDIFSLAVHKDCLVAFGSNSIEFFRDVAYSIGSPLLREVSYFSPVGLVDGERVYLMIADTYKTLPPLHTTYGNTVFFVGKSEAGLGLFKIQDFKVTKLEIPVLERSLNYALYSTAGHATPFSLFGLSFNGRFFLCLTLDGGTYISYLIDPVSLELCTYTGNTRSVVGNAMYIFQVQNRSYRRDSGFGMANTFFLFYNTSLGEMDIYKFQEDQFSSDYALPCRVRFPLFDGGNTHQKHIKYVDVVGLLNDNVSELYYTKDKETQPYTSVTEAQDSDDGFRRYRNLGRGRRYWFELEIRGGYPISLEGIEIAYNLGTH